MNRLGKKCFIGSAALHGTLILVFVIATAFDFGRPPEPPPQIITLIPNARMTDRPVNSGGNPNGNPQSPPPAPTPPAPTPPAPVQPDPPKPVEPEPPKKVVKVPEPPKEIEKPVVSKKPVKDTEKNVTKPKVAPDPEPLISKTVIRRTNNTELVRREAAARAAKEKRDAQAREDRAATERYQAQKQRLDGMVGGALSGLSKGLSSSTIAEPVGPGGAAYQNYAATIIEVYKRAVYANHPQSDENVDAVIRIVVGRDGTVRSSTWTRRTGNSVLDKAVDRAMNSVRSLPDFPPEAKDSERTFNITIAFEAKRVSA